MPLRAAFRVDKILSNVVGIPTPGVIQVSDCASVHQLMFYNAKVYRNDERIASPLAWNSMPCWMLLVSPPSGEPFSRGEILN